MTTVPAGATTAKAARPRPKPDLRVHLLLAPTPAMPGIIRIALGAEPWTDYHFTRIPTDFGTAYRLVKMVPPCDGYDVLLDGERSTCECRGFLRWGHCKHLDGLHALRRDGKL